MSRHATRLTAAGVAAATPGKYFDGDGLILHVQSSASAYWLYRFTIAGKTREAGLGRARGPNSTSLAQAREAAGKLRAKVRAGIDPLADAAANKAKAAAEKIKATTFKDAAEAYIASHEKAWKNPKHRQQWKNTLDSYVLPIFGDLPVAEVQTGHITKALSAIWFTRPETASRLRGRIEAVLAYAATAGWRSGDNPARWRGHLSNMLPTRAKVRKIEHHAALPWRDIGSFMAKLRAQAGIGARALEFAILTAARSGEVRGATWPEIDMHAAVWTIPASRMKAGAEHRVPLSEPALAVLRKMELLRRADSLVFPGLKVGRPLSDMSLTAVLRRMGRGDDLTVHGFRSSFRDWTAENTTYQREVAEAALAHTIGDKTEAAYRRGDLFEKRRRLMEEWAEFCARATVAAGEVVALRRA